jgi:CBS domain-containing protein
MLLKDLCTPDAVCCGAQTTVRDAARLMRSKHVGDLIIVGYPERDRVPIGVITDRDLALEVIGNDLDAATATVSHLVRQPVVIANEEEDTSVALERMRVHGVRRIPVVDREGAAVGIITLDDLLRVFVRDASTLLEVMSTQQSREKRERR